MSIGKTAFLQSGSWKTSEWESAVLIGEHADYLMHCIGQPYEIKATSIAIIQESKRTFRYKINFLELDFSREPP